MFVEASRASAPAGFEFRTLTTYEDFAACVHLQESTWGVGFAERVPTAILRIASDYGGVLLGAFPEGQADPAAMVGFVFGLSGLRDGRWVHWSDMLAVLPSHRGLGLGVALKFAQRDQLLALGIETMHWSFDPMEALNARLNLNRLGARGIRFVSAMYGDSTSTLHKGIGTDRLVAEWDLRASATRGSLPPTPPALDDTMIRVAIPRHLQVLKAADPAAARRWREASSGMLAHHLAQGWQVIWLDEDPAENQDPCLILAAPESF
jgi:predicted GNAT superfamily acetyltransferase